MRRYNPRTRVLAWRNDRLVRSVVASVLAVAIGAIIAGSVWDWLWSARHWYDYVWPIYYAFWLPWLVALRAAIIDELPAVGDASKP